MICSYVILPTRQAGRPRAQHPGGGARRGRATAPLRRQDTLPPAMRLGATPRARKIATRMTHGTSLLLLLAVFWVSSLTSSGGDSHAVLLGLPLPRVGGFLGIPSGISGFLLPRLAANRIITANPTTRPALKSCLSLTCFLLHLCD